MGRLRWFRLDRGLPLDGTRQAAVCGRDAFHVVSSMRSSFTHDLRREHEQVVEHRPGVYLAIVDLDSYPVFTAENADRLDLLQHLCRQAQALTAVMWEAPEKTLRIKLLLTDSHLPGQQLGEVGRHVVFTGWVRSDGRLCLANQELLLNSSRDRARDLPARSRLPAERRSRLLLVPPGLYAVGVFAGLPGARLGPDYTVVLRHYPHPPPRIAPVRLSGLVPAGPS